VSIPEKANKPSLTVEDEAALGELLEACDATLGSTKRELDLRLRENYVQGQIISAQAEQLLKRADDKITTSPLFYFALGMVVTGLTAQLVK
jgi:hypothetical protein